MKNYVSKRFHRSTRWISSYLLTLMFFIECSLPIEYPVPKSIALELPKENTSIQSVWERVQQSESGFIRYEEEENELWLTGYVSSSDAMGNFYKEVYIQDHDQNPKRGLRLLLDQTALHNFIPVGMKVWVRLNGLGAGTHQGVLSLGGYQADGVAPIPRPLIEEHLFRSEEIHELTPLVLSIAKLSEDWNGLWVEIQGVQFAQSELGKSFSAEAFDTFDGERWLVSCEDFRSLIVSTSPFSKFKSVLVNPGSGTLSGIITRDYYNENYILKINQPDAIQFENSRCDPFFEQSWENQLLGRFEETDWINWIEKGTQYWEVYEDEFSLGQSLRIGSYRSKDSKTISWLVTPPINTTDLNAPYFSFRTSTAFADSSKLEVFYSINFNGNPNEIKKADWIALDAQIASKEDNESLWIDSGNIPIAETFQSLYFAFRYTGSGKTSHDGTFELDDLRVFQVD